MVTLGRKVTIARATKGVRQKDLERQLEFTKPYLSRIEHGHVDPKFSEVCKIALALGYTLQEFLSDVQAPTHLLYATVPLEGAPHGDA